MIESHSHQDCKLQSCRQPSGYSLDHTYSVRREIMKRARFHWCLIILGILAVAGLGQSPRRMQLDDLGRIVRVSDPQIAPDGKSIVIVVSRANYDENRYDADLVLVDVASGNQRVLTRDRRSVSHPRF